MSSSSSRPAVLPGQIRSPRLAFGPFELDEAGGVLRKSGIPVRLTGQPIQILAALLENPGEAVTREQLRARVWGEATFVDFEHGLNAAVNKLRRALGDSAEDPRFIETVPGRGYRFIATVTRIPQAAPGAEEPVAEDAEAEPAPPPGPAGGRRIRPAVRWLAAGAVLAAGVGFWWRMPIRPVVPVPEWKLTRLTVAPGLTASPAFSPDGSLIAYSSDRDKAGNMDLYVQQVAAGSPPIRLTFDGAGNTAPDFSPDGRKLVYRSSRNGGGLYEVPALGGESRLLVRGGQDPKYSPDGTEVAYWEGADNIAQSVPGNGTIWVAPVAGGPPRRVGAQLSSARKPIWTPDGRRLLVIGYATWSVHDRTALDWWLVPAYESNGVAVRVRALEALGEAGVQTRDATGSLAFSIPLARVPSPGCWLGASDTVIFSTDHGDSRNLWSAHVSDGGRLTDVRRLTTGAAHEESPSCAANQSIAFAQSERRVHLWSLPFDAPRGIAAGPLARPRSGLSWEEHPSSSADGQRMAFVTTQSGLRSVWVRDTADGREWRVSASPFAQRFPFLGRSGRRLAYSSYEREKRRAYVVTLPVGRPELVCDDCLRPADWSPDETELLAIEGSPYRIVSIHVASRTRKVLIRHPEFSVIYGRYSPDGRWLSFTLRHSNNRARIMIAPLATGGQPVPETAWIRVSEEGPEDRANWSPDGNTLYFTSSRDGRLCLWGQRIHPVTRQPVGEPFAAHHFHDGLAALPLGWELVEGRIALSLQESTGNIWMMSPAGGR